MIPKECKRLAEVDFPIAVVSKHSAREKSIRHGHPSTLHLWWARRPLAACRSMLLALLLPDPCDEHCPEDFKARARDLFDSTPFVAVRLGSSDADLQQALLQFIGDFANWDNSSQRDYLAVARNLVQAAHPEETPLVVDPFAGGGSIPLEALRLGCDAFASDLNPVAGLIQRVMLEDIPRHGLELADELRLSGRRLKSEAEADLAQLYPADPDGARPIAYLWARTVQCEAPNCGAEIPLMRSLWLCKKASRARALLPTVTRRRHGPPSVEYTVAEPQSVRDVPAGTVTGGRATCPSCGTVLPVERVRVQLCSQRGGSDPVFDQAGHRVGGARIMAVVTQRPGEPGKQYRGPRDTDYEPVRQALSSLEAPDQGIPDEPLPPAGTLGFRVQRYGMQTWADLFTARQKLTLARLCTSVAHANPPHMKNVLACVLGRCADYWSSGALWAETGEFVAHTFGRQALPMVWDFAEAVPWTDSSGNLDGAVEWVASVCEKTAAVATVGQTQLADACNSPLLDQVCGLWFTDPPYYDAIPYSDLSDFFLVWLKRAFGGTPLFRDPFDSENPLTPKAQEAVQDRTRSVEGRPKDRAFFESAMARAFAEGRRVLRTDGIGAVVFAHKTTEGWEALLSGMVGGGWTITASWPIATERPGRLRSHDSAALATSVHLVCRPRAADARVADWADVRRELPDRIGDWMERLQSENVRGADLVFACIGPALEVYSRHSRVETAEGHEIPLGGDPEAREPERRGFLAYVWELIGRMALEQVLGTAEAQARNGAAGALEEDARLTALFLWTLQATNGNGGQPTPPPDAEDGDEDVDEEGHGRPSGFGLVYDVVRRFAQPLGIHLEEWEDRIIKTDKGVVNLLSVSERAKQLFGEQGAQVVASQLERDTTKAANIQMSLFPDEAPTVRGRKRRKSASPLGPPDGDAGQTDRGATTLDRVHAAMLLQAGGRTNALRALLRAEVDRGPDFVRLANALSALYPAGSEEKRLVDAMLLAVPR